MVTEKDINTVVARIIEFYKPQQIILFGSYAMGTADENSDLDLLLVKDTDEPVLNRTEGIYKVLRDLFLPMDILVYTPSEIRKDKDRKFTFIHQALKTGKILYGNG